MKKSKLNKPVQPNDQQLEVNLSNYFSFNVKVLSKVHNDLDRLSKTLDAGFLKVIDMLNELKKQKDARSK